MSAAVTVATSRTSTIGVVPATTNGRRPRRTFARHGAEVAQVRIVRPQQAHRVDDDDGCTVGLQAARDPLGLDLRLRVGARRVAEGRIRSERAVGARHERGVARHVDDRVHAPLVRRTQDVGGAPRVDVAHLLRPPRVQRVDVGGVQDGVAALDARSTDAVSVTSPTTWSTSLSPCGASADPRGGERTSNRTSWPASASALTACDPRNPVPPVTMTRIGLSKPSAAASVKDVGLLAASGLVGDERLGRQVLAALDQARAVGRGATRKATPKPAMTAMMRCPATSVVFQPIPR